MHITEQKLKDILIRDSGVVDEKNFASASEESKRLGHSIADVLVGRGDITEDYLAELLEGYFGAPVVDLRKVTIPLETLQLVPEAYAKSKNIVVFAFDTDRKIAKVAMKDPLDFETIEFLRAKLDAWVESHLTTPASLKYGLKKYKKKIGVQFSDVITENVQKLLTSTGETDMAKLVHAVPVVTILDSIIENAIALNATDIHFEPLASEVLVRYRIDGILHEILSLHKLIAPTLVARVKVLANLQVDEHRVPQDGRFHFDIEEGASVDVRVNVLPVMHGEKVEMRLLKASNRPLTLEELGLSSQQADIIRQEISKPHGMVLVTGPTGSGKTTTLYAILHILNTPQVNINTVEDPIEYEIPRVNQTQVNTKAGITFANGLRSLLRQNPDIIMVGEIRDNETVDITIHAALTGHLLLSTLHTNDAPSAFPRFLDMGAQPFLVASTVNLIIAQRLVRKICSSCITSTQLSPEIERLLTAQISALGDFHIQSLPSQLFRGKGCKVCGQSGYQGQIGIYEVLRVSDAIRELVQRKASAGEIRKTGIKEGMVTMFEDGLSKVEKGVTTIDEVIRVVRE